jgi:hypothetical protein
VAEPENHVEAEVEAEDKIDSNPVLQKDCKIGSDTEAKAAGHS